MWTVSFREYVSFDGVKEGIQEVKNRQKTQPLNGVVVEQLFAEAMASSGLDVRPTTPQIDIGFGADMQIRYTEAGKQYSFFVDVTAKEKPLCHYFTLQGELTQDKQDAFAYKTERGTIYFGIKKKHVNWFYYEKPVVVVHTEGSIEGLSYAHIHNIKQVLISLHSLIVRKGYGARASQKVRPNIKRFRKEYAVHVDTPEAWGLYVSEVMESLFNEGGENK